MKKSEIKSRRYFLASSIEISSGTCSAPIEVLTSIKPKKKIINTLIQYIIDWFTLRYRKKISFSPVLNEREWAEYLQKRQKEEINDFVERVERVKFNTEEDK
jgi:hypothetical protein